jgi:hypothetical protein
MALTKQSKGTQKRDIKVRHEKAVIEGFLKAHYPTFRITGTPNPPDAIANDGTRTIWIEHTDSFLSEEEAKMMLDQIVENANLVVGMRVFGGENCRILSAILKKISKESYKGSFDKYGPGILIVTVVDASYRESSFAQLVADLQDSDARSLMSRSLGYIGEVYLELWERISSSPEESRSHSFRHLMTLSGTLGDKGLVRNVRLNDGVVETG